MRILASLLLLVVSGALLAGDVPGRRAHILVRGIYGGVPLPLMDKEKGTTLAGSGVNAIWIGERGITPERMRLLKAQGARVFAEFNTLHRADYLKEHPDAAPIGADGKVSPAPHGWQGICPTHVGYRKWRMDSFRALLTRFELDGIWLDYHHSHSSWERAEPVLPDTCFCSRCIEGFRRETGEAVETPGDLLGARRERWVAWRCGVFTDWVREFRAILDEVRPAALLGTFHCPWSAEERDGALRAKLAIDLVAQSRFIDVFSPMPYHARFGHADDPAWISRQVGWLGKHLGVRGGEGERLRIWPIVQLSDWGEVVEVERIGDVLDHATRPPATGVMVFAWGKLRKRPDKIEAMVRFYRAIGP